MLSATEANELRARYEPVVSAPSARMLVLDSPALQPGTTVELKVPTRLGRGAENAIRLDGDDFARRGTRCSSRAPTASGSRTSARRTGRSSTAPGSPRHDCSRPGTSSGSGRPISGWRHENRSRERADRHGPAAAPERGHVRLRPSALCRCRRRRRGTGGRDRVATRGSGPRGARCPPLAARQTLVALLREANDRIYRHALDDPAAAGMGTVGHRPSRRRGGRHGRNRSRRRLARLPDAGRRTRAADRPITRSSASSSAPGSSRPRRPSSTRTDR